MGSEMCIRDRSMTGYLDYGFHLQHLEQVVAALNPPEEFETRGGHIFSGEEGVLLLLRRFRTTSNLSSLTKDTGRSRSAISEAVNFMVRRASCARRPLPLSRATSRVAVGAHRGRVPAPHRRALLHGVGAVLRHVRAGLHRQRRADPHTWRGDRFRYNCTGSGNAHV